MLKITRQTRLSALQKLFRDDRATDGEVNPRLVQSIQQSLAADGYVFSEASVRKIGERVTR
jgi:hypothetical protein